MIWYIASTICLALFSYLQNKKMSNIYSTCEILNKYKVFLKVFNHIFINNWFFLLINYIFIIFNY